MDETDRIQGATVLRLMREIDSIPGVEGELFQPTLEIRESGVVILEYYEDSGNVISFNIHSDGATGYAILCNGVAKHGVFRDNIPDDIKELIRLLPEINRAI